MTLRAPDGTKEGDPIPGSKWFRSFCPRCDAPMRVTAENLKVYIQCSDCDPPHTGVGRNTAPRGTSGVDGDHDAFARSDQD